MTILAASTLHVFNIDPGTDASGKVIELSTELTGGLIAYVCLYYQWCLRLTDEYCIVSKPRDAPCGLKPRSETTAQLIRDSQISAQEVVV